ncbi:PilC/PilY family type IV pilus protein [Roseateles sp. NT4]|uniref:PilC/PilY family type IV pilus protein n=1 Tax=Roseateles sp. NT4 TaxID=3453715 RepID=UPI003EED39D9
MNAVRLVVLVRGLALTASLVTLAATSSAQVSLADQPVFTSVNVPGNLALALSVEFPTAISVAHPSRTYSAANTYIGYFDPAKCYSYRYTDGTSTDNYFYPNGAASSHACSGKWSGNFLNWASMQTIDPFRWALTGGYRVIDTSTLTVLEKAWATNQGSTSNFPDSTTTTSSTVSGATPYGSATSLSTRIWALGNKIRFQVPSTGGANNASFTARYYNNKTQSNPVAVTRNEGYINYNINGDWPAGVSTTNMSANWTGTVKAPTSGTYTFKIRGDDGVRLTVRINGSGTTYTINDTGWHDQGATDYTLTVPGVNANDTLNITAQFYQGGGGGEISLQWQLPNTAVYTNVGGGGAVDLYGTATHYNPANALVEGTLYEAFVRVKVCDPAGSSTDREDNCTQYGTSYKPTGLMQKYSDKIRYSAFGYLNDSDINRDGGVLRAKQKFIGPTSPVPGGIPVTNAKAEWDATTGVMVTNPDTADATATGVTNSGVMNYLNKFGEISPGSYKTYDPVGELYYAAQRYYRNLGNVPAWTNNATATHIDGFPVITAWDDPILYSCQRNFILGIGDVNTHADRNLPGATGLSEPTKPTEVTADTGVNAYDWTNRVGVLQGSGLGTTLGATQPFGGCCTNNGALMAGLAYWANINDIRSDKAGIQTIQTYWLDVLEFQVFKPYNQFYLAAKYGGFKPPTGYSDATATTAQFDNSAATKTWWTTTSDTTPDGAPRPDNYYTAARADQMVDGLTKTFSSIASQLSAYSTSFSTALPQVSALGVASYSTKFDAKTWTGELEASLTTFDANTGEPSLTSQWTFSGKLDTQAAGTGWSNSRNIVTYDTVNKVGVKFRSSGAGSIPSAQLGLLNTSYVAGDDSVNYLNYLRGERTGEVSSTTTGVAHVYRDRAKLLGDIVNAKARPVAAPAAPYSAVNNPGYDTFKTTYANRQPMVYVASNDGMVHAVNGSLTGTDAGKEVWAYVPGDLFNGPNGTPSVDGLASIGNPTFSHHFLVDATPLTIDLDFGGTYGGSGTADWRTILVAGLGKGGKAIYALDITDPASVTSEAVAAQKVLWEFKDADLGYTYGQPVVVKTRKYGWVVVAGSGYNNTDGKAYFFFINPRTGALLEKVAAPCPALTGPTVAACSATNQAGMAHVNAFVLDLTDGYADAIYGGDLMGNLWRLDVTGTVAATAYPTPVRFARLVGSNGNVLPITSKPLPVVQPGTNNRYITVGTGRLLDGTDLSNNQAQRFFAIIDGTNASFSHDGTISGETRDLTLTTGNFPLTVSNLLELTDLNTKILLNLTTQVGWYVDLGVSASGPGWRVLSDPTSFYGTVAFAATSPTSSDPCAPNGTSRIYAIDLGSGYCGLTGGGNNCYVSKTDGVVIDLTFYSVNINGVGKSVLLAGKDNCSGNNCQPVEKVGTRTPVNLGLQRLNWREVLINN